MFSQAQPSLPASRLRRREAAGAVEAALGQGSHGGHEGDPWGETMAKPWEIYGFYGDLIWSYADFMVCVFFLVEEEIMVISADLSNTNHWIWPSNIAI